MTFALSYDMISAKARAPSIVSTRAEKLHTRDPIWTRRRFLSLAPLIAVTATVPPSLSIVTPPPGLDFNPSNQRKIQCLGYSYYKDVLDGYAFFVKDDWLPVTSTGNDVAYRSLLHPERNLFVNISSPSTSKFSNVGDVGTPEEAGDQLLRQYLNEFMSTRIGIVRQGEFVSGSERTEADGKLYYDIEVVLRSYASRSQLAVTREERQRTVELEWERRLLTVIGVANKRKYEFRLQADKNIPQEDLETLQFMAKSFRCYEV